MDFTQPVPLGCPAGGALNAGVLWGTDVYTKDSTICVAAVHAGLITAENGDALEIRATGTCRSRPRANCTCAPARI